MSTSVITRGIDISRFSGPVSADQWSAIHANIPVAVVGSWHGTMANPDCADNLRHAYAAEMTVATYVVLNQHSAAESLSWARNACEDLWPVLNFVALDCELDGLRLATILDAVEQVQDLGMRPVIYTGAWWWTSAKHFGNQHLGIRVPLWASQYDGQPNLDVKVFGNWCEHDVMGKQFAGNTKMFGFSADINAFDEKFIGPIGPNAMHSNVYGVMTPDNSSTERHDECLTI